MKLRSTRKTGPKGTEVQGRCQYTVNSPLVSSVVLHLLHSLRVQFCIFSTRFECSFSSETVAEMERLMRKREQENIKKLMQNKGDEVTHSFRVCFLSCPLVSSVFLVLSARFVQISIFPTRFECAFRLLHSFRVCFQNSPLVSSVFYIFSTRFECVFRQGAKRS